MNDFRVTFRQMVDEGLSWSDLERMARVAAPSAPAAIGLASGGDYGSEGGGGSGGSAGAALGPAYQMTAEQLRSHLENYHADSPAGLGAMGPLARHEFDHNARGDDAIGHSHAAVVQHSNTGGNTVDLSEDDIADAAAMIAGFEAAGMHAEAVELANELEAYEIGSSPGGTYGFPALAGSYGQTIELANGQVVDLAPHQRFIDLSNAQQAHENIRRAEDRQAGSRRAGSADERLAGALDRVRRGTLTPRGPARLEFAASSAPGLVTGQATCGAADDLGYCTAEYHDMGCGSYAGPEIALTMISNDVYLDRAASPYADASGRIWKNQYGLPMDLTQLMESASGQRLANIDEWSTTRRETFRAQPVQVWGDPSDPDGAVYYDMPAAPTGLAAAVLAQAGIARPDPAAARERLRADPRRAVMRAGIRHPLDGGGGSMRERAERKQAERATASWDDSQADLSGTYAPMPGELPRYTFGQIALATPASGGDGTDSNGLTPAGQAIYKKLIARGFPAARALSFAKNAQNAKPGVFQKARAS